MKTWKTVFAVLLVVAVAVGCGEGGYFIGYGSGYSNGFDEGIEAILPSPTSTPTYTPTQTPTSTIVLIDCDIQWYEAINYIGEWKTVCGTVVGTHYASTSNGQPTFLNIGKDNPDPERFVVVIWGDDRGNFPSPPEDYYLGRNIAVYGLVEEYEGVAEIMVSSPSQIQLY